MSCGYLQRHEEPYLMSYGHVKLCLWRLLDELWLSMALSIFSRLYMQAVVVYGTRNIYPVVHACCGCLLAIFIRLYMHAVDVYGISNVYPAVHACCGCLWH